MSAGAFIFLRKKYLIKTHNTRPLIEQNNCHTASEVALKPAMFAGVWGGQSHTFNKQIQKKIS